MPKKACHTFPCIIQFSTWNQASWKTVARQTLKSAKTSCLSKLSLVCLCCFWSSALNKSIWRKKNPNRGVALWPARPFSAGIAYSIQRKWFKRAKTKWRRQKLHWQGRFEIQQCVQWGVAKVMQYVVCGVSTHVYTLFLNGFIQKRTNNVVDFNKPTGKITPAATRYSRRHIFWQTFCLINERMMSTMTLKKLFDTSPSLCMCSVRAMRKCEAVQILWFWIWMPSKNAVKSGSCLETVSAVLNFSFRLKSLFTTYQLQNLLRY